MKIPLLDIKGQYRSIKDEIVPVLNRICDDQDFILGNDTVKLEEEMSAYCGTKYAVGVASGTDAIILALKTLGIKDGDEVITTPFTFFATAESISIVGARPVFVDIDPKTYNIDPNLISRKITSRTKAIIPVHLYGQCADMDPISDIARKNGIKIIEDAAQSIGARYNGRKAGSLGDIGAISFFPSKNLGGFGDGGMVVTDDKITAEKIRTLRVHGSSVRYVHSMIGVNSRLDNIQAAVLRVKLKYLDRWLEARRKNAEFYNKEFKGLPVDTPYTPDYNIHTYHQYTLRLRSGLVAMLEHLSGKGIEARTYYPIPLHLQECYKSLKYRKGDMPESEKAVEQVFSIPVYPELTGEQKAYVADAIRSFFK